jgi:hypothetical protein
VGDVPILRNSERSTFRRCPQKWWWTYREGLTGSYEPASALWFGTGVHEVLAQWYRPGAERGLRPDVAWNRWVKGETEEIRTHATGSDDYREDVFVDAATLGEHMLKGYYDKYAIDKNWDVIATEQPFQVEIPHPDKPGKPIVVMAGTFDGVYRDKSDDEVYLMEHKTAKALGSAHLEIDTQAGTYWLVAQSVLREQGVLSKGQNIKGIQYNYLKKSLPDERPKDSMGRALNQNGSISKVQPGPLFDRPLIEKDAGRRRRQLEAIQDEAVIMGKIRKGKLPLTKSPDWTCHWQCPFFEMCVLHDRGGVSFERYKKAMYTERDPYADHRKSAAVEAA